MPYGDFLRAKQAESPVRYGIDNQSKEVIATNQQLSQRGIEVLSVDLERGFTMLSQDIGLAETGQEAGSLTPNTGTSPEAGASILGTNAGTGTPEANSGTSAEIAGSFHWGFSEVLISQGQMNIHLDELVKLTKTPSLTWACEQFVLGRDEFRRHLYKEALQSVTRAIEGQGSNQGNDTEFRFHFLVGTIRLGSHCNTSPELINPQLAQQAFLAAARCAEATYPADAGQALICAGRAALVAGEIEDAIRHTRKGLNALPTHAIGMYQLARALFLRGMREEAADWLAEAILLNVEQALHASGDPDFIAKTDFLVGVLRQALERYEARHRQVAERYRRAWQTMRDFSFKEVPADAMQLRGLIEIQVVSESSEAMAASKTLFGYSAAINHHLQGFRLFPACFDEFKAHCIGELRKEILPPPRREDYLPANSSEILQGGHGFSKAGLASGIVSGITVLLFESSQIARPIYRGILDSMSELFLIPFLTAVGITAVVVVAEDMYREYVRSKHKSALAAFQTASYTYTNLKNSLEEEIADIQRIHAPKEFTLPANLAKPGAPSGALAAQKRASGWANL